MLKSWNSSFCLPITPCQIKFSSYQAKTLGVILDFSVSLTFQIQSIRKNFFSSTFKINPKFSYLTTSTVNTLIYHHILTLSLPCFYFCPHEGSFQHTARAIVFKRWDNSYHSSAQNPAMVPISIRAKAKGYRKAQKDNTWCAFLWFKLLLLSLHSLSSCHNGLLNIPGLESQTVCFHPRAFVLAVLSAWNSSPTPSTSMALPSHFL